MDAGDLKEHVLSKGRLSEGEALRVLRNVTEGLVFLRTSLVKGSSRALSGNWETSVS